MECPLKIYNKDGVEMMEVKSIDLRDDLLVVKGKMMGSMATTIHITPQNLWEAFRLLPWKTRFALPWLLLKGRQGSAGPLPTDKRTGTGRNGA